jgi:hypothetical protein
VQVLLLAERARERVAPARPPGEERPRERHVLLDALDEEPGLDPQGHVGHDAEEPHRDRRRVEPVAPAVERHHLALAVHELDPLDAIGEPVREGAPGGARLEEAGDRLVGHATEEGQRITSLVEEVIQRGLQRRGRVAPVHAEVTAGAHPHDRLAAPLVLREDLHLAEIAVEDHRQVPGAGPEDGRRDRVLRAGGARLHLVSPRVPDQPLDVLDALGEVDALPPWDVLELAVRHVSLSIPHHDMNAPRSLRTLASGARFGRSDP